jgi:hypothetical protein
MNLFSKYHAQAIPIPSMQCSAMTTTSSGHSSLQNLHNILQVSIWVANKTLSFIFVITTPLDPLCVLYFTYTSSCVVSLVVVASAESSLRIGRIDAKINVLMST